MRNSTIIKDAHHCRYANLLDDMAAPKPKNAPGEETTMITPVGKASQDPKTFSEIR